MLRGIDDFETGFIEVRVLLAGFDEFDVFIVDFLPKDDLLACFFSLRDFIIQRIGQGSEDLQHRGDGIRYQLATGLIVDLIAVVLLGIVGGGDHDPAGGFGITDAKGEFGGRPQIIEDIGLEPHLVEDRRGEQSEMTGIDPVVMAYDHAPGFGIFHVLNQKLPKGNGDPADGQVIDPVGSRAHDAPEAPGAEFGVFEEGVGFFLFV